MTLFTRSMAVLMIGASVLLAPGAHATMVLGTFSGAVNSDGGGTDLAGNDWSGSALTGTLRYDTSLFTTSVSPDGTVTTATATGLGALAATIMIGTFTHTFTDQTSSSIYMDTGLSEVTYANTNSQDDGTGASVTETFSLDLFDALASFLATSDIAQSFTAPVVDSSSFTSNGSFTINNSLPDAVASAFFTIDNIVVTASADVPEPGSLALFGGAVLVGLVAARWRAASRAARMTAT